VIAYRRAEASDMAFVVDSWIDSYKSAHAAGMIAMGDFRTVYQRQIALALARPGTQLWVAYHPGDTDHTADIYGWAAVEHSDGCPYVQYCYVKSAYRRMGIAKSLLAKAGITPDRHWEYSCKTGIVTKLAKAMPNARWNPLRIRFSPKGNPA
jgi:GNAT superfamily N-acetyltransferase